MERGERPSAPELMSLPPSSTLSVVCIPSWLVFPYRGFLGILDEIVVGSSPRTPVCIRKDNGSPKSSANCVAFSELKRCARYPFYFCIYSRSHRLPLSVGHASASQPARQTERERRPRHSYPSSRVSGDVCACISPAQHQMPRPQFVRLGPPAAGCILLEVTTSLFREPVTAANN